MLALVHIGMMKAGSTWLFRWLTDHPELAAPFDTGDVLPGKNCYFWNRADPLARHLKRPDPGLTPESYAAAVASVPKAIDVTDSYAYMPRAAIEALRGAHPDALVTYTLRDPIEALWSHMRMHTVSIEDLAAPRDERQAHAVERMLENARPDYHWRRWRHLGLDPLLLPFPRLVEDPLWTLRQIADRLDIDPDWWNGREAELRVPINAAERPAPPLGAESRARLERILADG